MAIPRRPDTFAVPVYGASGVSVASNPYVPSARDMPAAPLSPVLLPPAQRALHGALPRPEGHFPVIIDGHGSIMEERQATVNSRSRRFSCFLPENTQTVPSGTHTPQSALLHRQCHLLTAIEKEMVNELKAHSPEAAPGKRGPLSRLPGDQRVES